MAVTAPKHLKGPAAKQYVRGAAIYSREGFCITCHQEDGGGLDAAVADGFPPLAGSRWVTQSEDRLIKITLKGLMGPITVKGKKYPGLVPMTPLGAMMNDQEVADVLTYVRNSFGNKAEPVTPEKVKAVREATKSKAGFYTPEEILKEHPHK